MDIRNIGESTAGMSVINFHRLPKKKKIELFEEIQKSIKLPLASIEKDWWVVQTIGLIFQMDVAKHLLFKGGTSLSKAWALIERFSEDIDLALNREFLGFPETISRSQVSKLRKNSLDYLSNTFFPELKKNFYEAGFEEIEVKLGELESVDQDPLIFEIYYPTITEKSKYVGPKILVEIGSRSMSEPFTHKRFSSLIGEHFAGQSFADIPLEIPCVNPERTYLEKMFLLHEEFQRPSEKIRVNRLSRHLYDIYKISQTDYAKIAVQDRGLYETIVNHRKHFSRMGGINYQSHFPPNLNPIPPDNLLGLWKNDYKAMQNEMIYGDSPSFEEMIKQIERAVADINN